MQVERKPELNDEQGRKWVLKRMSTKRSIKDQQKDNDVKVQHANCS